MSSLGLLLLLAASSGQDGAPLPAGRNTKDLESERCRQRRASHVCNGLELLRCAQESVVVIAEGGGFSGVSGQLTLQGIHPRIGVYPGVGQSISVEARQ